MLVNEDQLCFTATISVQVIRRRQKASLFVCVCVFGLFVCLPVCPSACQRLAVYYSSIHLIIHLTYSFCQPLVTQLGCGNTTWLHCPAALTPDLAIALLMKTRGNPLPGQQTEGLARLQSDGPAARLDCPVTCSVSSGWPVKNKSMIFNSFCQ